MPPDIPRSIVPCSIVPALFHRFVGVLCSVVPCSGVPGFIVCLSHGFLMLMYMSGSLASGVWHRQVMKLSSIFSHKRSHLIVRLFKIF